MSALRRNLILLFALVACAIGYSSVYVFSTAGVRQLEKSPAPELAWLKQEFNLPDAEFRRICELHETYLPQCRAMCAQIDAQNTELRQLLGASTNVTPEVERLLAESGRLRADCQKMMLGHFFEVSRTMPPDEGRRYLAWVQEKAFHPTYDMPPKDAVK